MITRRLSVADPEALSLARLAPLLRDLPQAFWLRDETRIYFGAFACESSTAIDPEPELLPPVSIPGARAVPRWVGVLPYEAFRAWERPLLSDTRAAPLVAEPAWLRYPAVACFDGIHLELSGESPKAVECLAGVLEAGRTSWGPVASAGTALRLARPLEEEAHHAERVRVALQQISQGNLYQVNLARRFLFETAARPLDLLARLGPRGQAPFSAALDLDSFGVVSMSPELFLDASASGTLLTRPIKGTRPRATDPHVDQELARALDASEKERAELAMVVDLERNDLGRIARAGTVRLERAPFVVTYPMVHHREAEIAAELRPGVTREQLLRAMLPSGSVTGAPKTAAMELIARLEPERRGLYTGALGFLGTDGSLRLSMAIRILCLRDGLADYFSGGGIVADSEPWAEVQETRWKAAQLSRLLENAENWPS